MGGWGLMYLIQNSDSKKVGFLEGVGLLANSQKCNGFFRGGKFSRVCSLRMRRVANI